MEQKIITVMQRLDWPNKENGNTLKYDLTPSIQQELEDGWLVGSAETAVSDGGQKAIVTTTFVLQR